jgi:hypothetical protein
MFDAFFQRFSALAYNNLSRSMTQASMSRLNQVSTI